MRHHWGCHLEGNALDYYTTMHLLFPSIERLFKSTAGVAFLGAAVPGVCRPGSGDLVKKDGEQHVHSMWHGMRHNARAHTVRNTEHRQASTQAQLLRGSLETAGVHKSSRRMCEAGTALRLRITHPLNDGE